MKLNIKNKLQNGGDFRLIADFKVLAKEISNFGDKFGFNLDPFSSPETPYFSALNSIQKINIIDSMKTYIKICQTAISEGDSLNDDSAFLWAALKTYGFKFTSDLFEHVKNGDIVEVYTSDNIQVFRNFRFMELCSYTLEDIYCRPWTELFERKDPEKLNELVSEVEKILLKKPTTTTSTKHLGRYPIIESTSYLRREFDYTVKYISPYYERGHDLPRGYIFIEDAEITFERCIDEEEEHLKEHYRQRGLCTDQQTTTKRPNLAII